MTTIDRPIAARTAVSRVRRPKPRTWLGWLGTALVVAALWPATLGGLTGLTIVNGHSMDPTFATGDLVVSLRQPSYAVGDVISYQIPEGEFGAGMRVVHRVFAIDDSGDEPVYLTIGDNNLDMDEWRPASSDVLGRIVVRIPGGGIVLDPAVLPYEAAALAGLLVTVLLWRARRHDGSADSGESAGSPGTAGE